MLAFWVQAVLSHGRGGQGGRGASSAGGRYTAGRRTPAQRPRRCGYETWILVLVFDSDIKLELLY